MMKRRPSTDFGASNRPRKPRLGVIFLVGAVALTCIVLGITKATQVFEPDLMNIRPHLTNRRSALRLIQENTTAAYNTKSSSSEKNQYLFPVYEDFMFPNPTSALEKKANEAYVLGAVACTEMMRLSSHDSDVFNSKISCPSSISREFGYKHSGGRVFVDLPCGIEVGSVITIKGQPIAKYDHDMNVQFVIELLSSLEDESGESSRIFHFNPRLKGDFSGEPVIELNTGYRGHWGIAQRCREYRSWSSSTVDGEVPCEGWAELNSNGKFPFVENRMFELKIEAGLKGYHVFVDGRPTASFTYRPGFPLDDISIISIKGDIQVEKTEAESLPSVSQTKSFRKLSIQTQGFKAPSILQPSDEARIFVGIISSTKNFDERMAIRRTWLRSHTIQTSRQAAARFFVALHEENSINVQLKKEAEYYRDMVILPFIDHYHLLVLKTLALVQFGVQNVSSNYIMKCDDDTFVNMDVVVEKLNETMNNRSLFMGLFNWEQGPERKGKWAVTYEEWPDMLYPPYANGPAYIISKDIGEFIISSHKNHSLEIFKMEDVSMGIWVFQYNETMVKYSKELGVRYEHNRKFFQSGCVAGYLSTHYQSPRQMLCLWEKLNAGSAQCCDM